MGVLSRDDIDRAFDLDQQLRHVGPLVDRVLSGAPVKDLKVVGSGREISLDDGRGDA